jgi:hypothetical protein
MLVKVRARDGALETKSTEELTIHIRGWLAMFNFSGADNMVDFKCISKARGSKIVPDLFRGARRPDANSHAQSAGLQ